MLRNPKIGSQAPGRLETFHVLGPTFNTERYESERPVYLPTIAILTYIFPQFETKKLNEYFYSQKKVEA